MLLGLWCWFWALLITARHWDARRHGWAVGWFVLAAMWGSITVLRITQSRYWW